MANKIDNTLQHHLISVKEGKRRFENAFQGVSRMILDGKIEKITVQGKTTYNFNIFGTGKKHIIGMYDEINSFVSFVKDAAEGGSSKDRRPLFSKRRSSLCMTVSGLKAMPALPFKHQGSV